MAIFHLEDGCTLVVAQQMADRPDTVEFCYDDRGHDFSERHKTPIHCDHPFDSYLYDLCSKCGARLYPPGGFKAKEHGDG